MKKLLMAALVGLATLGASAEMAWVDVTPAAFKFGAMELGTKVEYTETNVSAPYSYTAPAAGATGAHIEFVKVNGSNLVNQISEHDGEKAWELKFGNGYGTIYFYPSVGKKYDKMRVKVTYAITGATQTKNIFMGPVANKQITDIDHSSYKTTTTSVSDMGWQTAIIDEFENGEGFFMHQEQLGNAGATIWFKEIKFESYEEDVNATVVVLKGEGLNNWDETLYKTTDIVDNCATFVVPSWNGGEFGFMINGTFWGSGRELQNGVWEDDTFCTDGIKNMTLPESANGKKVTFTIAVDNGHIRASWPVTQSTIDTADALKFYNYPDEGQFAWDWTLGIGKFDPYATLINTADKAGFVAVCNNNGHFGTAQIVDLYPEENHFCLKINKTQGNAGFGEIALVNHVDEIFGGWARVALQIKVQGGTYPAGASAGDKSIQIIPMAHDNAARTVYMQISDELIEQTTTQYNEWMQVMVDVKDFQSLIIRYNRARQYGADILIRGIEVTPISEAEVIEDMKLVVNDGAVQNVIATEADLVAAKSHTYNLTSLTEGEPAKVKIVTAPNRKTSGIEAVEVVESAVKVLGNTAVFSAPAKVYNLSGVCVAEGNEASLAAGLYIAKVGEKAVKFVVR